MRTYTTAPPPWLTCRGRCQPTPQTGLPRRLASQVLCSAELLQDERCGPRLYVCIEWKGQAVLRTHVAVAFTPAPPPYGMIHLCGLPLWDALQSRQALEDREVIDTASAPRARFCRRLFSRPHPCPRRISWSSRRCSSAGACRPTSPPTLLFSIALAAPATPTASTRVPVSPSSVFSMRTYTTEESHTAADICCTALIFCTAVCDSSVFRCVSLSGSLRTASEHQGCAGAWELAEATSRRVGGAVAERICGLNEARRAAYAVGRFCRFWQVRRRAADAAGAQGRGVRHPATGVGAGNRWRRRGALRREAASTPADAVARTVAESQRAVPCAAKRRCAAQDDVAVHCDDVGTTTVDLDEVRSSPALRMGTRAVWYVPPCAEERRPRRTRLRRNRSYSRGRTLWKSR
eukprot:SAG11_NODE_2033_length_3899_cov_2.298421_3_plen_405_part_00